MLHVLSSLSNKNHTNPLSLTSLSQLNLLAMGLRPLSNRDTIQPWMGHWPSSTPTLESERRSRVEGRGIDPESCDYGPGVRSLPWVTLLPLELCWCFLVLFVSAFCFFSFSFCFRYSFSVVHSFHIMYKFCDKLSLCCFEPLRLHHERFGPDEAFDLSLIIWY